MDKQALIIFRGDDGIVRSMEIEIDTELVESAEKDGILQKFDVSTNVLNEVKRFLELFSN